MLRREYRVACSRRLRILGCPWVSRCTPAESDWGKHGYWKDTAAALPPTLENMPRIHCDECSAAEFVERFERPALPCVISGFADGTPAASWTTKAMGDRFGDVKFKCGETPPPRSGTPQSIGQCRWPAGPGSPGFQWAGVGVGAGEDDDGYSMRVKLKYFIDYCQGEVRAPSKPQHSTAYHATSHRIAPPIGSTVHATVQQVSQ